MSMPLISKDYLLLQLYCRKNPWELAGQRSPEKPVVNKGAKELSFDKIYNQIHKVFVNKDLISALTSSMM